jgi:hypothetical protein
MVAREDIDDQAGFAVRVGVQYESRLTIDLVPLIHFPTRSPAISEPRYS